MLESKPLRISKYGESNQDWRIFVHDTEVPCQEARFAMSLLERFGLIAARDGGEDSAGRAKTTEQTPEQSVERAFLIAELAYKKMRAKGMLLDVGTIEEITEKLFPNEIKEAK